MASLFDWLRGKRGGGQPSPAAPKARPTGAPASASAAAAHADSAVAGLNRPASDFGPIATALGIAAPAEPAARDEAAEGALARDAELVLAHFRDNPQGPASAPSLSLRILNLVASPDADLNELSRLISADPALSAGVLTVANSAAYTAVREIETVRDAITRLGFEEVARVAGAVSAKSLFSPKLKNELQLFGARFAELYHRSLTVATGAAWATLRRRGRSDRAFLGGMLHDVGVSIALRSVAALALDKKLSLGPGDPRLALVLDRVHVEIGEAVHLQWGMPQYLVEMASRHHEPAVPAGEEYADLHAVRLVSALYELRAGSASASASPSAESPFARRAADEVVQSAQALGLSPLAVRPIWAELNDISRRVASNFSIEGPSRPARAV